MTTSPISYKRHRFPPQIIAHAVWLNVHVNLSLSDLPDREQLEDAGLGVA